MTHYEIWMYYESTSKARAKVLRNLIVLRQLSRFVGRVQDDLICLPQRVANSLGSLGPIVLCTRVTSSLTLLDLNTLRTAQIDVSPQALLKL